MSRVYKLVLGTAAVAACTGLGCLLWAIMTPTQEQLLEMQRKEMKENPARMAHLRSQNEMILKVLKEAAETKVNITHNEKWNSK